MSSLTELEHRVHTCTLCKIGDLKEVVKHYPIYSFGNPHGKKLLAVGLNPSTREYEDNYVSSSKDPEKRHNSQMNYFQHGYYGFFTKLEKFFQGEAKTALKWVNTPWEKVGFTDLTKCPTRNEKGQWTQLKTSQKRRFINNCQQYLVEQIDTIKPKVILAYGADVCKWLNPGYKQDDAFTTMKKKPVILVPQRQDGYPIQIIKILQHQIAEALLK